MVDARLIRLAALLGAILLVGVPSALAQSAYDKKREVDTRISGLREDIAAAKAKEGALTTQIQAASQRIDALGGDIGALTARISELESELAAHRAKLDRLKTLFEEQTRDFEHLKRQYQIAQRQLEERLVGLYQSDETDSLGLILQVQSLGDLLDQLEYFDSVGRQDRAITSEIKGLQIEMKHARERTKETRDEVAAETAVLAEKTAEQIAARQALVVQQEALASARSDREGILATVKEHRHEAEEDLDALQASSAALAAQIRAAQSASSGGSSSGSGGGSSGSGTSSSGFIWPVSGVVTSGFGWRWGRMHEGIDIAAPAGSPVRAVAAGRVIFSGWMGGYGNLVVLDHGNGLSTAYAHLSAIYAGGDVGQGATIGTVGCTGSCTGNHLHFEVRVNGAAVDPMGYL
ncbi:MAG TPA: peptidoglycan DD-metalloendopeptidase family protein [Gaiellaceae bacterium]|nr:peptidoglycan DD-metalloendopeptidase family protein [Gaiellaceae bacterium]